MSFTISIDWYPSLRKNNLFGSMANSKEQITKLTKQCKNVHTQLDKKNTIWIKKNPFLKIFLVGTTFVLEVRQYKTIHIM